MAPFTPDPSFARAVDAHGVTANLEKTQHLLTPAKYIIIIVIIIIGSDVFTAPGQNTPFQVSVQPAYKTSDSRHHP